MIEYNNKRVYTKNVEITVDNLDKSSKYPAKIFAAYFYITQEGQKKKISYDRNQLRDKKSGLVVLVKRPDNPLVSGVEIQGFLEISSLFGDFGEKPSDTAINRLRRKDVTAYFNRDDETDLIGFGTVSGQ